MTLAIASQLTTVGGAFIASRTAGSQQSPLARTSRFTSHVAAHRDRFVGRQKDTVAPFRSRTMQMPGGLNPRASEQRIKVPMAYGLTSQIARNVNLIKTGFIDKTHLDDIPDNEVLQIAASTTVFIRGKNDQGGWSGSGVLVDTKDLSVELNHYPKGTHFILTNNHVAGDAKKLTVTLPGGEQVFAEVAETKNGVRLCDELVDFAIVAINMPPEMELPKANLGYSSELTQGEEVLVAGYPIALPELSITWGHVVQPLAETGELESGIQTDAAINPGNSGGPMLSLLTGKVVGLNSYGFNGGDNLGFAQPIDAMLEVMEDIDYFGRPMRGYSGLAFKPFALMERQLKGFTKENGFPDDTGTIVRFVDPDSPAAAAGIEEGDVIVSMNVMVGDRILESNDINFYNSFQQGEMDRLTAHERPGTKVIYYVYKPKPSGFGYNPVQKIEVELDELTAGRYALTR